MDDKIKAGIAVAHAIQRMADKAKRQASQKARKAQHAPIPSGPVIPRSTETEREEHLSKTKALPLTEEEIRQNIARVIAAENAQREQANRKALAEQLRAKQLAAQDHKATRPFRVVILADELEPPEPKKRTKPKRSRAVFPCGGCSPDGGVWDNIVANYEDSR